MIGFLYPVLGLAALAAAIPIILHLMRRREVRRLTFPAIRYIRQAEQRQAQRLRLRHLALLAMRVLLVLLLAAAAAGPLVGRGGPSDHRPTALAIVIDPSLSSTRIMGERRILDLQLQNAGVSVDLATSSDRIAVFSATRAEAGAVALEGSGAHEYLGSVRPTAEVADLPGAIAQAEIWLETSDDHERELHLFTDLQSVSLEGQATTEQQEQAGDGISVIVQAPELPLQANGTPGVPRPEIVPLTAGRQTRVSVSLNWYGPDVPPAPVILRLVAGENVVSATEARFGEDALLVLPPQDSGWAQGHVEIDHHGLAADDRRYFTWLVRPPSTVAVLGDPGRFVPHALEALEGGGRLRNGEPNTSEVWLAAGGERIADGLAAGRATIVLAPASPLELPRLNLRLEQARIPWRYETDERPGSRRIGAGPPVEGMTGVTVRQAYRLMLRGTVARDTVLLRLDDGSPWLVRGTTSDGAIYLLLGSSMTPEASDLPMSAAMIPFLDALIGSWARPAAAEATVLEGEALLRLPDRARTARLPDGSEVPLEGGAPFKAAEPGNYAVFDGEGLVLALSVNAPLREADLATARQEELEAVLPAASWSWIRGTGPADWRGSIYKARRGKLARRPLVVLLILISIVEAALAAAGRRAGRAG
ncbi:MAG: BatA domain-containing protein [Gemmatimonadota bacterium]|nr:MAG: BatA domain-containing protein [Gemmatimonadota bacterium]